MLDRLLGRRSNPSDAPRECLGALAGSVLRPPAEAAGSDRSPTVDHPDTRRRRTNAAIDVIETGAHNVLYGLKTVLDGSRPQRERVCPNPTAWPPTHREPSRVPSVGAV
jgi:hypothetical protein